MISIFDLEKRFDWFEEYDRIIDFIDKIGNIYINDRQASIHFYADKLMEIFPLNESARSLEEYFTDYGFYNSDDVDDYKSSLLFLNFYYVLIDWTFNKKVNIFDSYDSNIRVSIKNLATCLKKIEWFLEKANYKIVNGGYDDRLELNKILFVKRNEDVDSILHTVSHDIAIDLLTYIDFRFENDLAHKEAVIARLYKDVESKKDELNKSPNLQLYKDTKYALNIPRHHREYHLNDDQRIKWCDNAFRLYIHLIRSSEIALIQKEMKEIKPLLK